MAKQNNEQRNGTASTKGLGVAVAAAAAAAGGLFLWRRGRGVQAEESTAEEVQAHPS
ncbi:MAG TPA: hypothetical protein VIA98_00315 [Allosphingosinicella sp.]|jgi:hypothetical protein